MRTNGYLGTSGQKSDHAIRSGDLDFLFDACSATTTAMHFHYGVTFTGYIRCFCATTSHDLLTLTFWPWECVMYSASHVQPTYQFLLSYDCRLL